MAGKMKYTVYNTVLRKYLQLATQPMGCEDQLVTEWTRHAERAQGFPGKKSAEAMVRKLGGYSEFVVKNGSGEVVA